MSLAQMLQQSGVIESMAKELGIDEQMARTGAGALLPAIVAGMGSAGSGRSQGPDLGALIGGLGGGGLLDSVLNTSPTPIGQGNEVLGAIFGSKDTSRGVASEVAAFTGIDEGMLKKMLPILAMAAAGYMAKGQGSGSASGNPLGGMLGSILGSLTRR